MSRQSIYSAAEIAFRRVLKNAIPSGGYALGLVEGFFDESEAGLGQKIFCLGGYLVASELVEDFSNLWLDRLAKDGISIFHMKDCAHGNKDFKNLSSLERSVLVSDLISLIHEYVHAGVSVSVHIKQYDEFNNSSLNYYEFCTMAFLYLCRDALEGEGCTRDIFFNFEAGHRFQGKADRIINELVEKDSHIIGYAGHAYYPKKTGPALMQAADLLVWLTSKNNKNIATDRKPRKDAMRLRSMKHYEQIMYVKDGVQYIGIATPHNRHLADAIATDQNLKSLFSGDTPKVPQTARRFDGEKWELIVAPKATWGN